MKAKFDYLIIVTTEEAHITIFLQSFLMFESPSYLHVLIPLSKGIFFAEHITTFSQQCTKILKNSLHF